MIKIPRSGEPRPVVNLNMNRPLSLLLLSFVMLARTSSAGEGDPIQQSDAPGLVPFQAGGTATDDLAAAYRSLYLAFSRLGAQRETAIGQAAEFERATLKAEPKKGFERLSAADSRIFEAIAISDPRSLLALSLFYEDLAYRHTADRNWGLALRAHNSTEELLRRLAGAAETEDDRAVASAAYQGFAADLLDNVAPGRAMEALEQAIGLTPRDIPANLTLAILLQRDERYAAAALRLDRVLTVDPAHREGRLRRALLSAKVDPEGRALKALEELSAGPEGDWITVVATQERGRLLLEAGEFERAIAWFGSAADRFPTEHSLRTALSFAQSRDGRRNAAAISARGALNAPRDGKLSARRRFAESPVRIIEPRREATRTAAEARWDGLRIALGAVPPAAAPAAGAGMLQ